MQNSQKLAEPIFLVSDQVPRFRKHALHHGFHFRPFAVYAGPHKVIARVGAGTMGSNDLGDHGR